MKLSTHSLMSVLRLATVIAIGLLGGTADAETYRVIHNFQGSSDGWGPRGVPAVAKNGDLYGVTYGGGTSDWGTVFKLTAPLTRGGRWKKAVLYNFPGGQGGGQPISLVLGTDGNLYGDDGETIFELSPPTSRHRAWNYTALYTLNQQNDGAGIEGLVFDAEGNLYGATELGGDMNCSCGTVFELKRPAQKDGQWLFSVLYAFMGGADGYEPFAGVTLDQKGNLYGTTIGGGTFKYGAVYRVSPPMPKGSQWTETVVYSFDGGTNMGIAPSGPVTFDGSGNMYGTTGFGGDLNCQAGAGCGVVFELSPQGGTWSYTNLYSFQGGNDGILPEGYLVLDSKGSLYSTTRTGGGGTGYSGIAFRLSPPAEKGNAWTETVLHRFLVPEGAGDNAGLVWGKWNELYGVTYLGGTGCPTQGCGTVFELQP